VSLLRLSERKKIKSAEYELILRGLAEEKEGLSVPCSALHESTDEEEDAEDSGVALADGTIVKNESKPAAKNVNEEEEVQGRQPILKAVLRKNPPADMPPLIAVKEMTPLEYRGPPSCAEWRQDRKSVTLTLYLHLNEDVRPEQTLLTCSEQSLAFSYLQVFVVREEDGREMEKYSLFELPETRLFAKIEASKVVRNFGKRSLVVKMAKVEEAYWQCLFVDRKHGQKMKFSWLKSVVETEDSEEDDEKDIKMASMPELDEEKTNHRTPSNTLRQLIRCNA